MREALHNSDQPLVHRTFHYWVAGERARTKYASLAFLPRRSVGNTGRFVTAQPQFKLPSFDNALQPL
ncbi:hypothetical protein VTO73DRAFT_14371 [Trametes versicolor]